MRIGAWIIVAGEVKHYGVLHAATPNVGGLSLFVPGGIATPEQSIEVRISQLPDCDDNEREKKIREAAQAMLAIWHGLDSLEELDETDREVWIAMAEAAADVLEVWTS